MCVFGKSWGLCTHAPVYAGTLREAVEQLLRRLAVDYEYWRMP